MIDGGLEIENAIRNAVDNNKDFSEFADCARKVAIDLNLTDEERNRIFSALAKAILDWK